MPKYYFHNNYFKHYCSVSQNHIDDLQHMMLSLPTRKKKKPIPLPQASPAERRRAVPRSRSFSSDLNNRINQNPSSFSLEISSESRKKEQYHVLSPSDLCNGLKDELPLRFVVKHGEYGDNQDSTFVENEELVAHFIQTVEYVLFMSGEGKRYRIPINSNTNACPIYNPTKNISDALNGYIFPSPKHLILESTCPMFVSVIQGHAEEDPKYTVEVNDVLFFPRETAKSAGSGKKKSIKCTHVASNLTKFIKEESKVIFSTRPHQILLPLSTLMRYITCPSTHVLVEVPKSASYVGVFLEQGKINNAICTRVFTSEQEAKLFALPEQFDLDIEHIKSGRREQEILCIESAERLKNFNPANVNYHVLYSQDCKVNDLRDDTQLGFYNAIVKNNGENGVICPQTLKRYFPLKFSQPDTINGISQPFQNASSIENRVALMEEAMQTLFTEIKLLKEKIDRLTLQQENNANEKKKDKELAESAFDMAVGKTQKYYIMNYY